MQKAKDIAEKIKDALVQTMAHPIDSVEYAFGIKFSLPQGQGSGTDADVLTGASRSTSPLSQSRTDLILQGIRNGLGGISFFEGGGPFSPSGGTVLVNSGAVQRATASLGANAGAPPNATLSNGSGEDSHSPNGNQVSDESAPAGNRLTEPSGTSSTGGAAANAVGAAREQAVADAVSGTRSGRLLRHRAGRRTLT
ncbi:hypothetical protein Busp01_57390 [Trinickia caryophylli]|nr:hypothetical protein Busp01_57390 [Trinickia caryophylli]